MTQKGLISALAVLAMLAGAQVAAAQEATGADTAATSADGQEAAPSWRGFRHWRAHGRDGGHMRGDDAGMMRRGGAGMGAFGIDRFNKEFWTEADADADGKLTAAEVDAWAQARFSAADSDKDGLISHDELAATIKARMSEDRAQQAGRMANRVIAEMDRDGDGKLSAADLRLPDRGAAFVARFDRDGDGAVSADEAKPRAHRRDGKRMHQPGAAPAE